MDESNNDMLTENLDHMLILLDQLRRSIEQCGADCDRTDPTGQWRAIATRLIMTNERAIQALAHLRAAVGQ